MPNFQFHFDRISFWLGFLAATLLWWVVSRVRPLLPQWREQFRQYLNMLSQRNFAGVEMYLRREVLRIAQRQHLAAPLFSLDEIVVQPWLLTPPTGQDPAATITNQSTAGQIIPYLPDWPELSAPFGVPTISPAEALKSGRNLVFIGQAGSGRTVALAYLASQLSREDPELGNYTTAVTTLLHVLDLDVSLEPDADPMANLVKAISNNASVVMQPQIPRFLKAVFRDKQRRFVLLLDGLDELPAERMKAVVAYLAVLLKKYPAIQTVTTASTDYLDGLTKAKFYPLAVAGWNQDQRREFTKKWGKVWSEQFLPEIKKQSTLDEIDPLIMDYWLSSETTYISPLEWTLRIWGAYAGDLSGNSVLTILDTHLSRFLPGPAFMVAMEELGHTMLQKSTSSLSYDEMESVLSGIKLVQASPLALAGEEQALATVTADAPASGVEQAPTADTPAQEPGKEKTAPKKKRQKTSLTTQGEQIITALLQGGVLIEQPNHQIRFANPVFLGFLGGMKLTDEEAAQYIKAMDWQVLSVALQYAAACSDDPRWIYAMIEDPAPPLFKKLLTAARWLRDAAPSAEWRSYLMRTLVGLIQNEALPLGTRARLVAAFYLSGDPSTSKLFKQLLASKSEAVKRVALLGCGALGNPQLINDILQMLADPQQTVRYMACMALAATSTETALNAVVEILLSGDEEIRQAAAESLALNHTEGHKILEEAAGVEDLLTRRAAVFGLMQVREPWAKKVLEKIAIEDGQWIVRNAASQALEAAQKTVPPVPKPLPRASDSAWLLTFASKLGMGILPGQPATDVLLAVLKSGTIEEQIAALYYLRDQPDEGVIGAIYNLLYSGQIELSEPVLHALWWMNASGAKLPNPTQFGLG